MLVNFNWQEFSDPRDADDARYSLNGREFDGNRLIVEFAKGVRTYICIIISVLDSDMCSMKGRLHFML